MFVRAADMDTETLEQISTNAQHAKTQIPEGLDADLAEKMRRILAKAQQVAEREIAKRR